MENEEIKQLNKDIKDCYKKLKELKEKKQTIQFYNLSKLDLKGKFIKIDLFDNNHELASNKILMHIDEFSFNEDSNELALHGRKLNLYLNSSEYYKNNRNLSYEQEDFIYFDDATFNTFTNGALEYQNAYSKNGERLSCIYSIITKEEAEKLINEFYSSLSDDFLS